MIILRGFDQHTDTISYEVIGTLIYNVYLTKYNIKIEQIYTSHYTFLAYSCDCKYINSRVHSVYDSWRL